MQPNWFIRKGILFFPASLVGWIILAATIALLIYLFLDIDSRSHSASDTLMNFAFNMLFVGVIYCIIGLLTEKKST